MRKISKLAIEAFKQGVVFSQDNTQVIIKGEDVQLSLHGHVIAWRRMYRGDLLYICMCGYGTRTTRERLNTLLPSFISICQHKGEQKFILWLNGDVHRISLDTYATYCINLDKETIERVN